MSRAQVAATIIAVAILACGAIALWRVLESPKRNATAVLTVSKQRAELWGAAQRNDRIAVERLVLANKDYLNAHIPGEPTPLHAAASNGAYDAARVLLRHGANPNVVVEVDGSGDTPLHWAASRADQEMVKLLLDHGADSRIVNGKGETALAVAKRLGHDKVADVLTDGREQSGSK